MPSLDILGAQASERFRELVVQYGDWAMSSPLRGAISFLLIAVVAFVGLRLVLRATAFLFRMITYPIWAPFRREKVLDEIQRASLDPTGVSAIEALNRLTMDWAGAPEIDVESAERQGEIWMEGKDLPVSYPARFYHLRVPRGLGSEVRSLMQSLGQEEGWMLLNRQDTGATELISNTVGYRV